MNKSIFLFCRVNTKKIAKSINKDAHVAAAYNKCCAMVRAFNSDNSICTMVTSPVLKGGFFKLNKFHWLNYVEENCSIVQLCSVGWPILDRFISAICFVIYVFRKIKKNDTIIIYNFFPEYILAIFFAKIKKINIIIDVEDAPRNDESGGRGFVNRISFFILKKCNPIGYLTVSHGIVNKLKINPALVIYGVVSEDYILMEKSKNNNSVINVVYGGALLPETGLHLFVDALKLLIEGCEKIKTPLHFFITGFGKEKEIINMIESINFNEKVSYTLDLNASLGEYLGIIKKCDVGLCLKNPFVEMGSTTFPSKVIEIAAHGLLLVSSKVSDVPIIFKDDEALFLDEYNANSLVDIFMKLSLDRSIIENCSRKGKVRVSEDFSESAVRVKFINFLNKNLKN